MILQPAKEPEKIHSACDAHKIQSIHRESGAFAFVFADGSKITVPVNDSDYWATSTRAECGLGLPPPAQTRLPGSFYLDVSAPKDPKLYVHTGATSHQQGPAWHRVHLSSHAQ